MRAFWILLYRRWLSLKNSLVSQDFWAWTKKIFFGLAGLAILVGLYFGFVRVLNYLEGVSLIGSLLSWKLTAMTLLTTFSMVAISGLITAMTTLYYSYDLRFLMSAPVPTRFLFLDKSLETAFYSSWTLALVIFPYILALGNIKSLPFSFYFVFSGLFVPFLALGAAFGIGLSLALMYFFPSSKTRDVIWIFSSLAFACVYVLIRYSQPEKLIRPDALEVVADYLNYLQAPTAAYLPSWWLTKALMAYTSGNWAMVWRQAGLIVGGAVFVYLLLVWAAGRFYVTGFSGSQEGVRWERGLQLRPSWEQRGFKCLNLPREISVFLSKDRKTFFRDVKHWSQLLLIMALVLVYLFSIRQLPLETPDLKSFVSFLNIGIAGFVIAALSLRFTFPAISLEGKSYWIFKSAPLNVRSLMREKFLFSVFPTMFLGTVLVGFSNHLLGADVFISSVSVATILLCTWTLCGMGVGFGALFPRFHVENVHQIESSAGGFLYMACALGYLTLTVAVEAGPIRMYFMERMGRAHPWNWNWIIFCVGTLLLLNAAAFYVPGVLGRRVLENYEGD
ncbi:MAG: hypothetical protein HY400_04330 [Elusimicrobia bacterium]|nr:hypothetical protein [Elusimicrobiota bacterium]